MPPKTAPQLACRTTWLAHPGSGLASLLSDKLHSAISLALIDTSASEADLESLRKLWGESGAFYYSVPSATLDFLASAVFLGAHPTEGAQLVAITRGTPLGGLDFSAALAPSGSLHLALSATRYHTLGLEGAASPAGDRDRYNVEVQVRGKKFLPARRHYQRVHECLSQRLPACEVWVARASQPPAASARSLPVTLPPALEDRAHFVPLPRREAPLAPGTAYPDSVQMAERLYRGLEGTAECSATGAAVGAKRPREEDAAAGSGEAKASGLDLSQRHELLGNLLEYCGALLAGLVAPGSRALPEDPPAEATASVFAQPSFGCRWPDHDLVSEMTATSGPGSTLMHWGYGLIPGPLAYALAQRVSGLVGDKGMGVLCCRGFAETPISFAGGAEHGPGREGLGENDVVLVMLPGGKCVVYALSGEQGGFLKFS